MKITIHPVFALLLLLAFSGTSWIVPDEEIKALPLFPNAMTNEQMSKNAHNFSVAYRSAGDVGYCKNRYEKLRSKNEGYFELTRRHINQIAANMDAIDSICRHNQISVNSYRLIYGVENGHTFLMVVPIVRNSQTNLWEEKVDVNGNNTLSLIYKVEDALPCPRHCNIDGSKIIQGNIPDTNFPECELMN
jgi:hypothetical protein